MAVRFILGRSGTGKSSYCIKSITKALQQRQNNQPLILLVPEQATYQAEKAILSNGKITGYSRLHVLSFDRLGFFVSGKKTAGKYLSLLGRQMIIHQILRKNQEKLRTLGASAFQAGLAERIAQTIEELCRYDKTPTDIEKLVETLKEKGGDSQALKFTDIGFIFGEYLKFIEDRFIDSDMQLIQARKDVAQSPIVRGARLWVDGFAGFTASELAVLAELFNTAEEIQIALCMEPTSSEKLSGIDSVQQAGLFYATEKTYVELTEIVKKNKLKLEKPIFLNKVVRFAGSCALAHIERNLFKAEFEKLSACDGVEIIAAQNSRTEIEFAAGEINKLVRKKNLRYHDIAVIVSDIESYQHYIRACFEDCEIPFFIDKRKPLDKHPVAGFISSAFRVVINGFMLRDVFAYLKTGLVAIDDFDISLLENYCLAFGIKQGDWISGQDWSFDDNNDFDEKRINQIRRKVVEPLLELKKRICSDDSQNEKMTPADFTMAIFDFLNVLGMRETLQRWIEEAVESGEVATADEHRQFFDKLVCVFDELCKVFSDTKMKGGEYFEILGMAFSQFSLAFIPPMLDQVLVGAIERSRHPDLKAVFLIGASQKQFPVPISYDSILTETDRDFAEAAGFGLAETVSQSMAQRQYLTYIAFTRPSQYLYVTYPLMDSKEKASVPSQFVENLKALFDGLKEKKVSGDQVKIENVYSEGLLADLLCLRLGKDTQENNDKTKNQLKVLLEDICEDAELSKIGGRIKTALSYDNKAVLDNETADELFAESLEFSASRLTAFASCPYKHFAKYILRLKERKEFKLKPLDIGNFYHQVLERFLKKLIRNGESFDSIGQAELVTLLNEHIEQVIRSDSFLFNFKNHSLHNAYIIVSSGQALEKCVLAIAEMVRASSFKPFKSEISFGNTKHSKETIGKYKINLNSGREISFKGKIDRLDVADIDGDKAAIVIDYKTKEKAFKWPEFYNGLNLQLPIYLLAIKNTDNLKYKFKAAGAFYIPVEAKLEKTPFSELAKKNDKFQYKAKGVFNGEFYSQLDEKTTSKDSKFYSFFIKDNEPYGSYFQRDVLKPADFEKFLGFAEQKIIQFAERIVSGEIKVSPYRLGTALACSMCEYKSVCRFDWRINSYNVMPTRSKKEIVEELGRVDG